MRKGSFIELIKNEGEKASNVFVSAFFVGDGLTITVGFAFVVWGKDFGSQMNSLEIKSFSWWVSFFVLNRPDLLLYISYNVNPAVDLFIFLVLLSSIKRISLVSLGFWITSWTDKLICSIGGLLRLFHRILRRIVL